jgi:hypothetical protein
MSILVPFERSCMRETVLAIARNKVAVGELTAGLNPEV